MRDNTVRNSQIRELRRRGVGPREIARRLKLKPNVVAGVLHRSGMTDPLASPGGRGNGLDPSIVNAMRLFRKNGKTYAKIAELFGVNIMTAHRHCRDVKPC